MNKVEVIAALKAKEIEFDESENYNILVKLLKDSEQKEADDKGISPELLLRAKKIGMAPEQIATYTDAAALEMACNAIKPQATSHPPVKKKPPVEKKKKGKVANRTILVCARPNCNHVWRMRGKNPPKTCPLCRSRNWGKE